jgi:hypothetical protein
MTFVGGDEAFDSAASWPSGDSPVVPRPNRQGDPRSQRVAGDAEFVTLSRTTLGRKRAVKGGSPDRLRNTVSEALSVTQIGHLIPVISLVVRGGTTCKDGSEHCAGALLLRSQMLYPLSYERWVCGCDLHFQASRGMNGRSEQRLTPNPTAPWGAIVGDAARGHLSGPLRRLLPPRIRKTGAPSAVSRQVSGWPRRLGRVGR